jgi:antitoxin (DNA-binding transcriptional repressor) of toxin-antitoxin stability system
MTNGVRVAVQDAGGKLPALVDQALAGQEVVLTSGDQPVVRLVPVTPTGTTQPMVGSAKGIVLDMADDFDAPLTDLKDYM